MRSIAEPGLAPRSRFAAEAEFLEGGYDRARMQSIADRAQINKAMLHYHFRTKDELFAQIFRDKASLLFPKGEAGARVEFDFIAFTCAFVDGYFALMIANPYLPSLLLQVAANHQELLDEIGVDFPRKFVRRFKAALKTGSIAPHDAQQFIVTIIGMCAMLFVGKNLIKSSLGLDDAKFESLLDARADGDSSVSLSSIMEAARRNHPVLAKQALFRPTVLDCRSWPRRCARPVRSACVSSLRKPPRPCTNND